MPSRRFGRSFDGIFREIQREMDEIEDEMDDLIQRARKASPAGAGSPLVYGWSLQVGPDGVPHFERFGNVGSQDEFLEALSEGWQAPHTTWHVDEEEDQLHFIADLPGIAKDQVEVEIREPDCVEIVAEGTERKYRTTCRVPFKLDPDNVEATFNNGVLDLTVGLTEPPKPEGKRIKIQ